MGSNQGEGNREAAAEFNKAEREFVNSPQGKATIRKGARVKPEEEAGLKEAELRAKAHGKNDDSDTDQMKD